MNDREDGGPAFPNPSEVFVIPQNGMSLRDWFAGRALQGQMTNSEAYLAAMEVTSGNVNEVARALAQASYVLADAMLAARLQ
jgi:hypothetical protein